MASRIDTDLHVSGTLSANRMVVADAAVGDDQVMPNAGIQYTKVQQFRSLLLAQPKNDNCTNERRVVRKITGATGTVISFLAGAVVPAGAATTVAVDLLVNGSSILSAAISLSNAQAAYETVSATISDDALAVGDTVEISITLTGSNAPAGLWAQADIAEDPQ